MNVAVADAAGELGKFTAIVHAFPYAWKGSLLDVGCRSGGFRRVLPTTVTSYKGLDIFPPADTLGNLELGLPFSNCAFDTVVALDVLEHTDYFHYAFAELCRVSAKYVVISLPNCYEIEARIKFLRGKRISAKYGLTTKLELDRHRWLLSYYDAENFFLKASQHHNFKLLESGGLVGPKRSRLFGPLVNVLPNLLTPTYLAILQKY